jgi:hypothetical protein
VGTELRSAFPQEVEMTFEENPLVLIAFIVATVEGWTLAKAVVRAVWERRRKTSPEGRPT